MKRIFISMLLIAEGLVLNAQEDSLRYKNDIGLVVSDFMDGSLQVRYERRITHNKTLYFGAAHKWETGLINISGIDAEKIKTSNISYGGYKFVIELRHYLKGTGRYDFDGFYLGPFTKASFFNSEIFGRYTGDDNLVYQINLDSRIRIQSVGMTIGYKLALSRRLNLDFIMAGPGVGFYQFSLNADTDLPVEFYEKLNQALDNFSYFDVIKGDFNFEYTGKKTRFTSLAYRYGISLSFCF